MEKNKVLQFLHRLKKPYRFVHLTKSTGIKPGSSTYALQNCEFFFFFHLLTLLGMTLDSTSKAF